MKTTGKDENRFEQGASRYAAYLETACVETWLYIQPHVVFPRQLPHAEFISGHVPKRSFDRV